MCPGEIDGQQVSTGFALERGRGQPTLVALHVAKWPVGAAWLWPVGRRRPELQGEEYGPTWVHRRAMAATYICCLHIGKYLRVDEKLFFFFYVNPDYSDVKNNIRSSHLIYLWK